jgi:hypothetical protein
MTEAMYAITVVFVDHAADRYVELGGAVWDTAAEQLAWWHNIPPLALLPSGRLPTCFLADCYDRHGDIESTKCIAAETVEALLDAPLAVLIDRARKKSASASAKA